MPFKSLKQARAAFGGYLGPEMQKKAKDWADITDFSHLPRKVKHKKSENIEKMDYDNDDKPNFSEPEDSGNKMVEEPNEDVRNKDANRLKDPQSLYNFLKSFVDTANYTLPLANDAAEKIYQDHPEELQKVQPTLKNAGEFVDNIEKTVQDLGSNLQQVQKDWGRKNTLTGKMISKGQDLYNKGKSAAGNAVDKVKGALAPGNNNKWDDPEFRAQSGPSAWNSGNPFPTKPHAEPAKEPVKTKKEPLSVKEPADVKGKPNSAPHSPMKASNKFNRDDWENLMGKPAGSFADQEFNRVHAPNGPKTQVPKKLAYGDFPNANQISPAKSTVALGKKANQETPPSPFGKTALAKPGKDSDQGWAKKLAMQQEPDDNSKKDTGQTGDWAKKLAQQEPENQPVNNPPEFLTKEPKIAGADARRKTNALHAVEPVSKNTKVGRNSPFAQDKNSQKDQENDDDKEKEFDQDASLRHAQHVLNRSGSPFARRAMRRLMDR